MRIPKNLKTLGKGIFDLVFPVSCAVCGKEGQFLCATCFEKLPKLPNQLCMVCRKPSPFGKTHPDCISRNTVDGIISSLSYKDLVVQRVIATFKYKFIQKISR